MLASIAMLFFFLLYGVLQERIMTLPYGPDRVVFKSSTYLVFNNRVIGILVAIAIMQWRGEDLRNTAPILSYAGVACSNFLATWSQVCFAWAVKLSS
jgi:adenosine 3'-phospho 5'-phosphosulfate transporter B2